MTRSDTDDARALARGLRARDPELLDALVEKYQYRLLRYLVSLTANRSLAEDLFQETWLRVLERGHQYDARFRFEPWLFRIGRNLFLDRVRRKPEVTLGELEGEDGAPFDIPDPSAPSPFDTYRRLEEQAGLARILLGLSAAYREVLVLRFQEDLGLEEIAAVTGAPLSTVKSRLYRGLAYLQDQIAAGAMS